jgi:hypothetical protein
MGISPDTLRRCSIEWGWKQRPRLSSVRATRPAGGTPGRFAARQRSLTHWLAPAFGEGRMLSADTDKIEALSLDRAALWDRVSKAPFLSVNEKRLAAGYGPAEGGDVFPSQQ